MVSPPAPAVPKPGDCEAARKLEWRRKVTGQMTPAMSPEARRKAKKIAEGNAVIPLRVKLWRSLEELLRSGETHTGRIQMGTRGDRAGAGPLIRLHTRAEIRDGIANLPMLLLDATMPVEVVRHYLPRLRVLADVRAAAPFMEIIQITGGWGKTSLVPSGKTSAQEKKRCQNRVAELGADLSFCMIAITWGFGVEETARELMQQDDSKAAERTEKYALETARHAALFVQQRKGRQLRA